MGACRNGKGLYLGVGLLFAAQLLGSCSADSSATTWIKTTYSQAEIDWACENVKESAAGLDWYPEIGFSFEEMEKAWNGLCR